MNERREGNYDNPAGAILTGIKDLFRKRERAGRIREEEHLENKNVLITGASSGLGFAVALQLAKKGANVYMACRSGIPEKGEKVKKLTGSKSVWMLPVDLSDFRSIHSIVRRIVERKIRFDIIICNAAIVPKKSRKTKQGLEEMFMVNYLAKYVLIRMLLDSDCLKMEPPFKPRIIIVSSESHRNPAAFEWENFGRYQDYGMSRTVELYGYYKLLLTTFAHELSRRLNSDNSSSVPVLALCPGPVNSRIAREAPLLIQPLLKLIFTVFFKSPGKAAEPVIYLATSADVENKSFDYLHLMSRKEIDSKASDPENGKRLWRISENLLREHQLQFRTH
jgi:NAD(P)-dependent dehydrogenase (short-subunit alcohol dehydrogenase family)